MLSFDEKIARLKADPLHIRLKAIEVAVLNRLAAIDDDVTIPPSKRAVLLEEVHSARRAVATACGARSVMLDELDRLDALKADVALLCAADAQLAAMQAEPMPSDARVNGPARWRYNERVAEIAAARRSVRFGGDEFGPPPLLQRLLADLGMKPQFGFLSQDVLSSRPRLVKSASLIDEMTKGIADRQREIDQGLFFESRFVPSAAPAA